METQIAWRLMADMFEDGRKFLGLCCVSRMVKHSGLSERRFEGVRRSWVAMLPHGSNRQNVGFGRKSTTTVT